MHVNVHKCQSGFDSGGGEGRGGEADGKIFPPPLQLQNWGSTPSMNHFNSEFVDMFIKS